MTRDELYERLKTVRNMIDNLQCDMRCSVVSYCHNLNQFEAAHEALHACHKATHPLQVEIGDQKRKEAAAKKEAEKAARLAALEEASILTPERRAARVAIAEDIISQIILGKLRLTHGQYFSQIDEVACPIPNEGNAQDCIDFLAEKCDVCAIGSAALSAIRLFDKVTVEQLKYDKRLANINATSESLIDILSPYFDFTTLGMLECAFERRPWPVIDGDGLDEILWHDSPPEGRGLRTSDRKPELVARFQKAFIFGEMFKTSKEIMCAVCANLIANDGEFIL